MIIEIIGCHNLNASQHNQVPSPYVAYKLLEYPDTTTATIANTTDPQFDMSSTFPFDTSSSALHALAEQSVEFYVIDDNDPDSSAFLW